jgi:hypothetical protein
LRSSRREFLARGSALAGVAAMTLPGVARAAKPAAAPAAPAAVPVAGLTDARRQTYRALVDTVVTEPGLRLDPAAADAAASEFASHYATWGIEAQRRADGVLDALEASSSGRPFAKLDRPARTTHLRACAQPTDDDPIGPERQRLDMAQGAMSLAAVTIGPSGGELDRPLELA